MIREFVRILTALAANPVLWPRVRRALRALTETDAPNAFERGLRMLEGIEKE